jgi:NADH-quinone oxidoreductase subunit C
LPYLEKVAPEDALERVRGALGDLGAEVNLNFGHVDVRCDAPNLPQVAEKLRDGEGIQCRFFTFLSAVDWTTFGGDEESAQNMPAPFEVLVHLYSPDYVIHVNIHVPLKDELICPTISNVFGGALWHEREAHEMFGIYFEGHPGLTNLYLPEDFEGHPLRKSFKLPTRIVKDWPGAKDPAEAAAGGR